MPLNQEWSPKYVFIHKILNDVFDLDEETDQIWYPIDDQNSN